VCDYCDCRELTPIRELSEEHERIAALAANLRDGLLRAEASSHIDVAEGALAALRSALSVHLEREEAGLFVELARRGGFDWYIRELAGDHERARATLLSPLASVSTDIPMLLAALDDLAQHIETEEYDLFPASRLILDDESWSRVSASHHGVPIGAPASGRSGERGT